MRIFVIFSEFVLDKRKGVWYHTQARVGEICGFFQEQMARTAMMQEIASKDGNFCGVCPVIGRLNKLSKRLRISLRVKEGSASVGHFSWLGVIRTAARTGNSSTVPRHYAN